MRGNDALELSLRYADAALVELPNRMRTPSR